jgi:hypothetical protein
VQWSAPQKCTLIAVCHVLDRPNLDDPGVVEQHVDAAEVLQHDVDGLLHLSTFADVAGDGQHAGAVELVLCAHQLVPMTGEECEPRAFLPEPPRQQ